MIYSKQIEEMIERKIATSHYIENREEAIAYIKNFWPSAAEKMEAEEAGDVVTLSMVRNAVFSVRCDPLWHQLTDEAKTAIATLHNAMDDLYFDKDE